MYVLDASVILKWYLQEEGSERALKIRQEYIFGNYNLALPDLILYEMANALKYEKTFTLNSVQDAMEALIDLGIDIIVPTKSLIKSALEFSFRRKITFYDAAYVALASELGYDFLTADAKLFKRVKDLKFVRLLSEI